MFKKSYNAVKGIGVIITLLLLMSQFTDAGAQYFGRNRPSYRVFDFQVLHTPNIEILHYLEDDSLLNVLATRSEDWYRHHQAIFRDTIAQRNPILFYETHAEFQQTTAISGNISESVGGVTEAFKNRVVMPLSPSFAQTDHILGHELVHAFQFNILTTEDTLNLMKISNLPLWLVEGMAEYFSIGSVDPHTAMWMRDAVLSDDIPTIRDMTRSNRYFPYRFGHALVAMIGKVYGDSVIVDLFRETAYHGYEKGFLNVFGIDDKNFSALWKEALINNYTPFLTDTVDQQTGQPVTFGRRAGRMNLSPSISPDGEHVVFLSERDVFNLDLFLAEAETGRVIRRLSSHINRNEIDAMSYMESSGTWSPDGEQFAFVVFTEGKNRLVIVDINRRRGLREIEFPGFQSISNPSWSPDGRHIVVSAMTGGASDLLMYDLESSSVTRITDTRFANLQPSWSPDGRYITYVTDKPIEGQSLRFRRDIYNIGIIDTHRDNSETLLPLFTGARNMNPLFCSDGKSIYFLSDRDGFRNLYRYDLEGDVIWQQTEYMRGITGITHHSPAVSIARETEDIVYSYFSERRYTIYRARPDDFEEFIVSADDIDFTAGTLPPFEHLSSNIVDSGLLAARTDHFISPDETEEVPYRPRFQLDYISNASIGVAAGRMGTGMAGSVTALFSDMVGHNQLFAAVSLNGEIYDFGAQVAYINQKNRIKWGTALSHIPYYHGFVGFGLDTMVVDGEGFILERVDFHTLRMFEDKVSLFAYYPFSQSRRIEASGEAALYYYRYDVQSTYYLGGLPWGFDRERRDAPDGFRLAQFDVAYVVDNSTFGMTAPVRGTRYRLEAGKLFGEADFFTALADYRRYFNITPFTLAFRSYNIARLGKRAESSAFNPLFLGYPWLVRGFDGRDGYWSASESSPNNIGIDNFFGSRLFVMNAEFRIPFSGPESIALIGSETFFTDLNFFIDGGLAMERDSRLASNWNRPGEGERAPVFSYGASLRINLFGYAILEPYYAIPFGRDGISSGSFGLGFFPGW